MLGRWDDRLIDQVSDVTSINFFIISCKILCKNLFNLFFIFVNLYKKKKNLKQVLQRILQEIVKKNTWNIRR